MKHGISLSSTLDLKKAADELVDLIADLPPEPRVPAPTSAAPTDPGPSYDGILQAPPADWVSPVKRNRFRYKLAAFDFDGSLLLRGPDYAFSWELVWRSLNFSNSIQRELKRRYHQRASVDGLRTTRVKAYRDWCEEACELFKSRGLTRAQMRDIGAPLTLTKNCCAALTELRKQGVATAMISGGIDTFLVDRFPDFRDYFDFVFINVLVFSDRALETVRATEYDFEGKAEALDVVCTRVKCSASEAVFVGDQFNDQPVMVHANRAIGYPPRDSAVDGVANIAIAEDDLNAIVPYVLEA